MALVFPGSTCQICGNELGEDYRSDDIVGLPEGLLAMTEFSRFNDSVMHQHCFQNWIKAEKFVNILNKSLLNSGRKGCVITNERKFKYL
ncbi:MAG: hypothetical protein OEY36_04355 [Gammaproteobacteria bacterium]|nr:hypothetical protein [Gammaproteobacteria bacterium]